MVGRYGLSELYVPPNGGKVTAQYVHPGAKHGQAVASANNLTVLSLCMASLATLGRHGRRRRNVQNPHGHRVARREPIST